MDYYIIYTIIVVLSSHFIADFICQSDEMAKGKSKCNKTLAKHVMIYSYVVMFMIYLFIVHGLLFNDVGGMLIPFLILSCLYWYFAWVYVWVTHFLVDYVTSRIVSKYFKQENYHMGFVVIGLDQLIHTTSLIIPTLLFVRLYF